MSTPQDPGATAGPRRVLEARLLGGCTLHYEGRLIPESAFRRRRSLTLLLWLLATPGHALSRDATLEWLWPEEDPAVSAASLRVVLSALRAALGTGTDDPGPVLRRGPMLVLHPNLDLRIDADAFEAAATSAMAAGNLAAMQAAALLYTGPLLPALAYDDWAVARREALDRLHERLLAALASAEATTDPAAAEERLRALLSADNADEAAARALMSLLAGSGRRAEALRVYQALASALRDELGLAPTAETEALRARILAQQPRTAGEGVRREDQSGDAPAGRRGAQDHPTNLPAPVTTFVGREWEAAQVKELLAAAPEGGPPAEGGAVRCRLLTLTGAGGCGKTRLALEVAAALLPQYPDGVWLVELAALPAGGADVASVARAISTVLGVREEPGSGLLATLIAQLQARRMLLVLDNCEHLVAACADLAATLLGSCSQLRILATSREALGIAGETSWLVPCLTVPGEDLVAARDQRPATRAEDLLQFEAVRLFLDRARAGRQGFVLTPQNAGAVVQICRRLDGIPLAIELAAARVGVLTVEQLAARLDDRFRLLIGGSRAALPRQQTLRATMDWSYALLTEPERLVLRRLAVFAGGCTLEAAEAVCTPLQAAAARPAAALRPVDLGPAEHDTDAADGPDDAQQQEDTTAHSVLDLLSQLVAKSLILATEHQGESRYSMLETVRQYAREHLTASQEEAEMRARHLHWCVALVEQAEAAHWGAAQRGWLERLETEHVNLRAALEWGLADDRQQDAPAALKAGAGQEQEGGRSAVLATGHTSRLAGTARAELGLRLAVALCWFWEMHGHLSEGLRWLETALAGVPATLEVAQSSGLSLAAGANPATARVRLLDERATAAMERNGLRARLLSGAGRLTQSLGNYERATALQEESLALSRELGDMRGVAQALTSLGNLAFDRGDYKRAAALNEESLALWQALGDKQGIATAFHNLGLVAQHQGHFARAGALHRQSLALQRELEDAWGIAVSLNNLASVTLQSEDPQRAWSLAEESLALFQALGDRRGIATLLATLGQVAQRRGERERAGVLFEESLALRRELGDTWGKALSLANLGMLAHEGGDHGRALALLAESLGLALELGNLWGIVRALEGLAAATGSLGQWEAAARLLGATATQRSAMGAPIPPADQGWYERDLRHLRAVMGEDTFAAAWALGEAMSLDEAIGHASAARRKAALEGTP